MASSSSERNSLSEIKAQTTYNEAIQAAQTHREQSIDRISAGRQSRQTKIDKEQSRQNEEARKQFEHAVQTADEHLAESRLKYEHETAVANAELSVPALSYEAFWRGVIAEAAWADANREADVQKSRAEVERTQAIGVAMREQWKRTEELDEQYQAVLKDTREEYDWTVLAARVELVRAGGILPGTEVSVSPDRGQGASQAQNGKESQSKPDCDDAGLSW